MKEKIIIANKTFDEERALYGSNGVLVKDCSFDGPADGESALKESQYVEVDHCFFNLRYPFWHNHHLSIRDSELTVLCRASLWYAEDVTILNTNLHGIKALRECSHVHLKDCDIISPEFGWSVHHMDLQNCTAESEYFMMRSDDLRFRELKMKGKYSFQYVQNATFSHCEFDTKDAFWHGKNITIKDSVIKGEYLAWYSQNLTLIRCKIIGTQPLCYCTGLKLIDCEMIDTDLAFEKSEVEATVTTPIVSVKNPHSGKVIAPAVGKIIMSDPMARGEVILRKISKHNSDASCA